MPHISERAKKLLDSPIRHLDQIAKDRKEKEKKEDIYFYGLNIGQPDIPTPDAALDAYERIRERTNVVAYAKSSRGNDELINAICGYYRRRGVDVGKNQVVVTVGGSEAIAVSEFATTDKNDEIIVIEPYFPSYGGYGNIFEVKIVPFTTHIESNFALENIESIEDLITPKTKSIVIINPSNPTGVNYKPEEIERVTQIAKKHDLFIIGDETYSDFVLNAGEKHTSLLSIPNLDDQVIVIDGASKKYSLCGARIGWLYSKNKEVIEQAALKWAQTRLSVGTVDMEAARRALELGDDYLEDVRLEYKSRRDTTIKVLEERVKKKGDIVYGIPAGAFYMMVKFPGVSSKKFAEFLAGEYKEHSHLCKKNASVKVAFGEGFYASPGKGQDEVRIAFILDKQKMIEAVRILLNGLDAYKDKHMK